MKEKFFFNLTEKNSLFWAPDYLEISAWTEHIPFAFWLVETLKPARIVELGVHNGNSYFAFCQAVKMLNINTVCYGVDTWEGDEHAGFYDQNVFLKVSNYNALKYSRFSTLIKTSFDDAQEYFINESIDLLHIDGLHTYEVVKHDFETWLPKLTKNAFVIFHDINVRERHFGVFKLWEELKQKYKHFHFDFGHGLGIIAVGNVFSEELNYLLNTDSNNTYYLFLRNLFSERGNFFKTRFEKDTTIEIQKISFEAEAARLNNEYKLLESNRNQIIETNKNVEQAYLELKDKYDEAILINNQDKEIIATHYELKNKYDDLFSFNHQLNSQYKETVTAHEGLKNKYDELFSFNHQLNSQYKETVTAHEGLKNKYDELFSFNHRLNNQHTEIVSAHNELKNKYDELFEANHQLINAHKSLQLINSNLELSYKKLLSENQKHEAVIKNQYKTLEATLIEKLNNAQQTIADFHSSLSSRESTIKELQKIIEYHLQTINWYVRTYEERTLLGTLKEKLQAKFKKKINNNIPEPKASFIMSEEPEQTVAETPLINNIKFKTTSYKLNHVNDLKILPGSNEYIATGTDPFFIADLQDKTIPKGWYLLSIGVAEIKNILLSQKIYYDCGKGFNEQDIWNLPGIINNKIETLINFPDTVSGLRFDPSTIECAFQLNSFILKPVNNIKVFTTALSTYKQNYWADRNYLSIYAGLMTSYLKSGKTEFKKIVWSSFSQKKEDGVDRYAQWCSLYDTISDNQLEVLISLSNNLLYQPLLSVIVPVYNAPVNFLKLAIESVRKQAYKNWELCIADDKSTNQDVIDLLKDYQAKDKRIKVVFRDNNGHISKATNSALEIAVGDYILLLDQDDELPLHSLYMVAKAINENQDVQLIYTDEDKIDEQGKRFDPYFKTDWNKDLFYSQNMINHLGVYKRSLIKKIGGFREGYEGSQDYDLALRCIENIKSLQIYHIPHVLYHWRAVKGSTALAVSNKNYAFEAGLKALNDHLKRTNQNGIAEPAANNYYRIKWLLPEHEPMVSIIIPTKDKIDILATCVNSILSKTNYGNFEILIVDNKSEQQATFDYYENIQKTNPNVKVYNYNSDFNFSAIINYGVRQSKGEIVLLLNNDTEVINNDWLTEITSQCMRKDIGAVGAKLYYPNGQIQHAGVFVTKGHPGIHIYLKQDRNDPGYFNKLNLVQNYSAVTGACLAIRKELYKKAGGLDETNLKVAYNDVDFCLKIRALGYENLWTPYAQLFHYESLSRGDDLTEINLPRFKREQKYMLTKWDDAIENEPYFNPNLNPVAYYPGKDMNKTQFAFPPKKRYEWNVEEMNVENEETI